MIYADDLLYERLNNGPVPDKNSDNLADIVQLLIGMNYKYREWDEDYVDEDTNCLWSEKTPTA